MVVSKGEFIRQFITSNDGEQLDDGAVQPNGLDLSIGTVYELNGKAKITNDEYTKPDRVELSPTDGFYQLQPDKTYIIEYGETIKIPEGYIGLVLPRSRLMRCGLSVETAVWDSGYEGIGEGELTVRSEAELVDDLRFAQMIYLEAEQPTELYDGSHQHENIDNES